MRKSSVSRVIALLGAAVLMSVAGLAQASGGGGIGGIVVGVGAAGYAGTVTGSASSVSEGNAIAATQVNGYGSSFQHTDGFSAGSATIGGVINHAGATVVTGTTQVAQVNSYGNVTGNAPIEVAGGMIANGTGGLAKSTNYAAGNAQFGTAQFAAIGGIVGAGGFIGF